MFNLHTRIGVSLLLLLSLQVSYANIDEKDSKKDTLESKKDINTTSLEKDLEGLLKSASNATMLSPSVVQGDSVQSINDMIFQSSSGTISRAQIENSASGNGDIGSLLRSLPNVQFDNAYRQAATAGEISPADISISGGLYYQNNFIVDGVNINNDLDPVNSISGSWNHTESDASGRSQGIAIDTDLLESIHVLDSNISAEYGGFTGGVVEAETRKPQKKLGFKLSHQYSNGKLNANFPNSLTTYNDEFDDYADGSGMQGRSMFSNTSREFTKHITRTYIESKINEKFGILASMTRTYSRIPTLVNYYYLDDAGFQFTPVTDINAWDKKRNEERLNINALTKIYYQPTDNIEIETSYTYAPDKTTKFTVGSKDESFDIDHGGHIAMLKMKWHNPLGKLTNTLSYTQLEDSITANGYTNYFKAWRQSDSKHWGFSQNLSIEGGQAPSEKVQKKITNKLTQEFTPYKDPFGFVHNFLAGIELSHTKASFNYTNDFYRGSAGYDAVLPMTTAQAAMCKQTDGAWCDTARTYDPGWWFLRQSRNNNAPKLNEYNFDIVAFNSPIDGKPVGYTGTSKTTLENNLPNTNIADADYTNNILTWEDGQFTRVLYHLDGSKNIAVNNDEIGMFLEDTIEIPLYHFGDLFVRPGLRLDKDSYVDETTLAPRFSFTYVAPWSKSDKGMDFATSLSFGANRYYGRNFYAYALRDGISSLKTGIYRVDPNEKWDDILQKGVICTSTSAINLSQSCINPYTSDTSFSHLEVPYADELSIGITQDFLGFNIGARYIQRNGKNEVRRAQAYRLGLPVKNGYSQGSNKNTSEKYGYGGNPYPTYYVYTNNGSSKSDIVTITLGNNQPIMYKGISNNFLLSFDWTNVERNYEDYDDGLGDDDFDDPYIRYNGKFIRYSEKPVENFARPYSIKLSTSHQTRIGKTKITWSNLFSFREGREINATKTIDTINTPDPLQTSFVDYQTTRLKYAFNWDTRLGLEWNLYNQNILFLNIDVLNVLNRKNETEASFDYGSGILNEVTYETGRQFWLEAGYKF